MSCAALSVPADWGCVLAVRANTAVAPCPGTKITVAGAMQLAPDCTWQRLLAGSGTKGVRHYDWAMLKVMAKTGGAQDFGELLHWNGTTSLVR